MLDQSAQPAVSSAPHPDWQTCSADWAIILIQLLEPDKCEGWVWKTLNEIKQERQEDLFLPLQHLLKEVSSFDHFLDIYA